MRRFHSLLLAVALFVSFGASVAKAQTTEERFQDLFVTAGYATAFGAALGAAMLSFVPDPAGELRYVAYGASLGFIGGSLMGTYVIFSPMISMEQSPSIHNEAVADSDIVTAKSTAAPQLAANRYQAPRSGLVLTPVMDGKTGRVESLSGTWTLATF